MNYMQGIRAFIIAGGAPITALLDTFSASAAIFARTKPAGYEYSTLPAVLIRRATMMDDISPFSGRSRSDALVSLSIYGRLPMNSNDDSAINAAAMAIRDRFRGARFADDDGINYQATVTGPIAAPVDDPLLMAGEIIQLRLNVGA